MVIRYLRYSTDRQDERQQANTIDNYLKSKGMKADRTYKDEGISGGVCYTKRSLFDLCRSVSQGDIVVISEISRLTRSGIGELSEIIKNYFAPHHLRLIICNVGLDIDCSDINPMTEMQLSMLATFARIEKCLIQERTKSSLEIRKKILKKDGSFVSKSGRVCTHLGRPKGCEASVNAINKSCAVRRDKARENEHNVRFYRFLTTWESRNGRIEDANSISEFVQDLCAMDYRTAKGLPFSIPRARAMIKKVKKIYA